ncbi:MAG: TRAP transporter large permease [Pusillimonas sp.]
MTSSLFIGLAALLLLAAIGVPIALSMALAGFIGFGLIVGWPGALAMVGQTAFDTAFSYNLAILPLFILMGNFITRARLSEDLYSAAYAFVGHLRGGLALSTLLACTGFSAVCGSSLATAATMSRVTMPSMRKFGYKDSLATGAIAAGGTLGILIPPSIALVLYGLMTNTDIDKLFIAGVIPGLIGLALYCAAAWLVAVADPAAGPPGERSSWRQRLQVMRRVWGVATLFIVVIGGIYLGVFTSTEAAGIGAGFAGIFAIIRGKMGLRECFEVLVDTTRMTAMLFIVVIGALIFSHFVNVGGLLQALEAWVKLMKLGPVEVLLGVLVVYIILGLVLESMSMMLLTVPIFFPLMMSYGFDPIWFGIIVVVVTEISLITPPMGMNIFVLRATLPDVSTHTIVRGVMPFVMADVLRLALLASVPIITLFLPNRL